MENKLKWIENEAKVYNGVYKINRLAFAVPLLYSVKFFINSYDKKLHWHVICETIELAKSESEKHYKKSLGLDIYGE